VAFISKQSALEVALHLKGKQSPTRIHLDISFPQVVLANNLFTKKDNITTGWLVGLL